MVNIRNKLAQKHIGTWLGALVVLGIIGLPNIWAVALGIFLAYKLFSPYLSSKTFGSKLYTFLATFLLYTLFLQCIIVASWMIAPSLPLQLTPLITAMVLLACIVWGKKQVNTANKKPIPYWNRYDTIALVLTVGITLAVVIPSTFRHSEYGASNFVQLMNANVDDASHLSLLNDHIALDRGILTGVDAGNLRNTTMYPAGWHSLNAVFVRASAPNIALGSETLVAYAITKVVWFAVLLYMAFRLSVQLWVNARQKRQLSWLEGAAFVCVAVYFHFVFVHIFIDGFYSFIPQAIYGILIITLTHQLRQAGKPKTIEPGFTSTFPLLFLAAVGGCLTWLLPLPAFIIFLAVLAWWYVWRAGTVVRAVQSFIKASAAHIPLYLLAITAILVQFYALAKDTSAGSVGFLEGLLLKGGITIYDPTFYLVFGIGIVSFLAMMRKRRQQNSAFTPALLTLLASMLVFISFVYLYQQLKIDGNAYYYYKLMYLLVAMATPLVIAGYAYLVSAIADNRKQMLLYSIVILCVFLNFVGIEPTLSKHPIYTYPSYMSGSRKISPQYNDVIYKNLKHVSATDAFNNDVYYFFYTLDKPQIDTASMLLKSNKPFSTCYEDVRGTFLRAEDVLSTEKTAQKSCKHTRIFLITSDIDKKRLAQDYSLHKLEVLTYAQAITADHLTESNR